MTKVLEEGFDAASCGDPHQKPRVEDEYAISRRRF